ncbi:hypothetical protein GCM10027418_06440 [Mariniluteicoccus endophyticus]
MSQPVTHVQLNADNPKAGMTLAELALFVQQAMRADTPPETVVHVAIGFSAQVQRITTAPGRPQ